MNIELALLTFMQKTTPTDSTSAPTAVYLIILRGYFVLPVYQVPGILLMMNSEHDEHEHCSPWYTRSATLKIR